MKKILSCLLLILIFSAKALFAQMPPAPIAPGLMQWFPGWYVSGLGDTVKGYIFLSNQIDNQKNFKFSKDQHYVNSVDFNTSQAQGYLVKDRLYRRFTTTLDNSINTWFLRCVQDGNVHLYAYCTVPPGTIKDGIYDRPIAHTDEKFQEADWLISKGAGDPAILPDGKKFIELMKQWMSDNPELVAKIVEKEKGYRQADVYAIVGEYNSWKKSAH